MTNVPGNTPKAKILVVDDDEGLLLLMAEALTSDGHIVSTATSGSAALATLAKSTPDLMLLDLKMRDVGGATLIKRLHREEAPVPFIVVTGQGDEKVAVDVMKHGALDYVMKDTGLLDLLPSVVRRALVTVEREKSLADARGRLAAALRATNDGVWEWQIKEGRVYQSARWKAILGYQPDELPDSYNEWENRIHPNDLPRFTKARDAFFASDATLFSIEYRLMHKDGTYRWILLRGFLERDAQGQPHRFTGADTDVTERKRLEKEILRVSDREQWRIGQELHDGLGQQLTAIELMCQSLREDLEKQQPELAAQAVKIGEFLRDAIGQTRSLAHGLTPFMLDADGLRSGLAKLVTRTASIGRVACHFVCSKSPSPIEAEPAGHLFRIAQEAVNNALKHSDATEITVSLSFDPGNLALKIEDNGKGLSKSRRGKDGIGLLVMRHRANTIGAELTFESKPGTGLAVICILRKTP